MSSPLRQVSVFILLLTLQQALYAFSDGLCRGRQGLIVNTTSHNLRISQHQSRFVIFENIPATLAPYSQLTLNFANNRDEWEYLLGPVGDIPAIYSITLDVKVLSEAVAIPPLELKGSIRFPGCLLQTADSETTVHFRVDGRSDGKTAVFTIVDIAHDAPLPWYKRLYNTLFKW